MTFYTVAQSGERRRRDVADDDSGGRRAGRALVIGRMVIAVIFVSALAFMVVRQAWIGAAIVFPFAAARTYFAVAAALGDDLGYRY